MKMMMRGLALAVALIVPAVSQAEFVVDDFIAASGINHTGFADTTRSAVVRVGQIGGVSGGSLSLGTASINSTSSWTLNFVSNTTGVLDPGALGYNHFLALRDLAVIGNWSLMITATGTGGTVPGMMTVALANGTTGTQTVDLTGLSNVGNLNGLTNLQFKLTALSLVPDGGGGNIATFDMGSMAAVPEPTSMALLGLTAVGGFFANRRRKKTVVA